MKKRILVTGSTGAIGKEVVKILSTKLDLYEVSCLVHDPKKIQSRLGSVAAGMNVIQGDITDPSTLKEACTTVDVTIHLAAIIPPLADKNPALARKVNIEGTQNLIAALEENSPNCFFLYASSITVYGDRLNSPEIRVGDPLQVSYGDEYGETKIVTEGMIQQSKLDWSIFRLSGILDPELNKPDPLMFHMPLDTAFEMCTTRDCGRAFVHAIEKRSELKNRMFNLAGGESCRASFREFLSEAFKRSGMGKLNFPKEAFASANFHCGYYMDGDDLEEILGFQQDSKEDYFKMMASAIPGWQKVAASIFNPFIKYFMLQSSDPWKAHKSQDPEGLKRYFGIE